MSPPSKKLPIPTLFGDLPPEEQPKKPEKAKDYAFDLVDALRAPFLTFSMSWADCIPDRIRTVIPMARLCALKKDEPLATYAECVFYMYTRVHEAPMPSDWADIYLHVSCKTLEDWFGEDRWEDVHAPRQLSEWLQYQLDGLRRHLYKKRREYLKQQLRAETPAEPEAPPDEAPKPPLGVQQTLFNF